MTNLLKVDDIEAKLKDKIDSNGNGEASRLEFCDGQCSLLEYSASFVALVLDSMGAWFVLVVVLP